MIKYFLKNHGANIIQMRWLVILIGLCFLLLTWKIFLDSTYLSEIEYEQRVYRRINWPVEDSSLMIVIPFISSQMPKLIRSLHRWTIHVPCERKKSKRPFLAFYVDGHVSSNLNQSLSLMWATLPSNVTSCFDPHIFFLEANLSSDVSHPDGPCESFYRLIDQIIPQLGMDHFQFMEPDVVPIQSFWLDKLVLFANGNRNCSQFWMQGSISRCNEFYGEIASRKDYHINGNSLYCVMDPNFKDYREKVKEFYPKGTPPTKISAGCSTGEAYETGYDHTLFQFANQVENFAIKQQVIHKFRYTNFIQNHCEDVYNSTRILHQDPYTFLVHGKAFFYSPIENQVVQTFHDLLHRAPKQAEFLKWKARLALGEESPRTLPLSVCHSNPEITNSQNCLEQKKHSLLWNVPWRNRFPGKKYMWTVDFHPGPVMCNAQLFSELGLVMHMEVDHGLCEYFGGMPRSFKSAQI